MVEVLKEMFKLTQNTKREKTISHNLSEYQPTTVPPMSDEDSSKTLASMCLA